MKLSSQKLIFRFFNLSSAFLLLLVFSQCISKEEEIIPAQELGSDFLEEIKNRTKLEDPDPIIEDPDYEELFSSNQSLDQLEELISISADGEGQSAALALLEKWGANASTNDHEMTSFLRNVDVDFILGLMDPEKPMDPVVEEFLQKMLVNGNFKVVMPEALRVEGLLDLDVLRERKPEYKVGMGTEHLRTQNPNNCADDIRGRFGSGARGCDFDKLYNIGEIEHNYEIRSSNAEARFNQRNDLIKELYSQRLLINATLLAELGRTFQYVKDSQKADQIKSQLQFFGLIYAYYIRIHLSTIYQSGLMINHLYYQNEIILITNLRDEKFTEAEVIYRSCIDWVNGLIIDETKRVCPGEEPSLY